MFMSTEVRHSCFLRGLEVWRPAAAGETLRCDDGVYHDAPQSKISSQPFHHADGGGLSDLAWRKRTPQIMDDLQAGAFIRGDAALDAGRDCGIALPFFRGSELRGVLVMLLERSPETRGAIEVWRPNDRRELALADSSYRNLEKFARLSQYVKFPCGAGLPGQVWQTRFPKVIGDLANTPSFVRVSGARADRLTMGLAIPFMNSPWELDSVALLLSSEQSPLARRIEVWRRDEQGDQLVLHSRDSIMDSGKPKHAAGEGPESAAESRLAIGEGVAGRVWEQAAPLVFHDLSSVGVTTAYHSAVAFPIFVGETVVSVVAMYF